MTEQEDKADLPATPSELSKAVKPLESKSAEATKATEPAKPVTKAKPAVRSALKPKTGTTRANHKKSTAKARLTVATTVPDLNNKDYPLHPERIWPD